MKVKDLIALLKKVDPESEVICSKDAEGHDYTPLYEIINDCVYVPENTWSGYVYYDHKQKDMSIEEWEKYKKENVKCVVLEPTN